MILMACIPRVLRPIVMGGGICDVGVRGLIMGARDSSADVRDVLTGRGGSCFPVHCEFLPGTES